MSQATAEEVYNQRLVERDCYLEEAFRNAKVTIPALIPDGDDILSRSTPVRLKKPFQSLGARGVNNLSAKLLIALLPSNSSFFKYVLSEEARDEADEDAVDLSEIQSRLARRESRINTEVELQGIRSKAYQILRHLLVAGNVLAYVLPEGGVQVFPLNAFVVKRDGNGKLLDLIFVEKMARQSITDENVLRILAEVPTSDGDTEKPVPLYTRVMLEDGRYSMWQEVNGTEVPETRQTFAPKDLPTLALRYTSIDGEDYGRAFVEEYRGDLTSFEQMSRDVLFASANAAKVVWAINPTAAIKPRKFMEAKNGQAVSAAEGEISAVRLDKGGDMQVATVQMDRLEQALSASFMLNSSFQRNAERVTAEEIRRLAQELEDTLGGVFSLLSQELQLPLATLIEGNLVRTQKGFVKLPDDSVRIGVVTGLAAIGRNQELENLREGLALVAEASSILPGLPDYINEEDLNRRLWTGSGVETEDLIKSGAEVQQVRAERQQAQSAQTLGTELAKGAGTSAGNLPPEQIAEAVAAQQGQ